MNRFSEAALTAALLAEPPSGVGWNFSDWNDVLDAAQLREAAVLIGLIPRETGWHVLLTRRTEHMTSHAGQVAFPGGRVDASTMGCALRPEAVEAGAGYSVETVAEKSWRERSGGFCEKLRADYSAELSGY